MTEAQRMSHPVSAKTKTDITELLERVERTTEMAQRYLKTSTHKPRVNNYFD
jgi:predicted GTPase